MKETIELIKAYEDNVVLGRKVALASVVHLEGSSYRRPGARMLINNVGELTGAISGGCLEGDALRKALNVIAQQQTSLVTYDTYDEEDASIGVQLGCEGVIQVLFEPIREEDEWHPIMILKKVVAKRQKCVLVTILNLTNKKAKQHGLCYLKEEDGTKSGSIPIRQLEAKILAEVDQTMIAATSTFREYKLASGETYTIFIEYVPPPISLVIVGAGNDALPVAELADRLGWEVKIVDGRHTLAKAERFQSACQIVVSKPESVLAQLHIDRHTAFVLMTHNYNYDLGMLKALLAQDIQYIGILGPKKKLEKMYAELEANGQKIDMSIRSKVFGPVGLEIGAETAEEIALSIIAEIKSVFSGVQGGQLRLKQGVIHDKY